MRETMTSGLEAAAKAVFVPLAIVVLSLLYLRVWLPRQRAATRKAGSKGAKTTKEAGHLSLED